MPGDIEEQKELKELLSRGEVRTMRKDLSLLREKEAEKEKEKIVSLKTEVEDLVRIAREKEEKIKQEAIATKEKVFERATEEVKMKEEIEKKQRAKIYDFVGEKTREMWQQEEEEKKKFMERIQAKAVTSETTPTPPPPLPPLVPRPPIPPSPLPPPPLPPPPPPSQVIKEELGTLIPRPPRRPSPIQKVLVRTVILLIVLFAVTFGYWLFFVRKTEPSPAPVVHKPSVTAKDETPQKEEAVIPASLIQVRDTLTLEVSTPGETKDSVVQTVNKKIETDGFTRILLKDVQNNKFLGLKEFFAGFDVKTPEGLLDKLDNDFTLFMFTATGTNRLGFVADVKDNAGVLKALNTWVKTVEKDTEGLFSALGKEKPAAISSFRNAYYKGKTFHYISFPPANFGLCWAIIDNRLLFTSSGQSMIQLINALTK